MIRFQFTIVALGALMLGSGSVADGAQAVVSKTGSLHYDTDAAFVKQWRQTLAPDPANKDRWAVVDTRGRDGIVLRAGGTGDTKGPYEHRVCDVSAGEDISVFDVSGAGEKSAFRAFTDFRLVSGPRKPMEAVRVNLAAVSVDGATSYTAALYANAGDKMFTDNRLRIDKVDFNTGASGRRDNVAFQESNITFKPGDWYRLEFTMTRKLLSDRSPVDLKLSVYELAGGVNGGARGELLKSLVAPMLPNLGKHVQFGMIGATASPYTLYLDNLGAHAQPIADPAANAQADKPEVSVSESTRAMVKYFMDRKHEYKKEQGTVMLALSGKPQMVIVVPDKAPAPVRYAGKELKMFLDQMTGGCFQIVNQVPADGRAIILGDTPQARKAGIDVNNIARDGYRIVAKGNAVIIAGKDDATEASALLFRFMDAPDSTNQGTLYKTLIGELWEFERGTLYGAYRFLEELGVRWFLPGPKGMVVPSVKDLEAPAFSMLEEPVFDQRDVGASVWNVPGRLGTYDKSPQTDFMAGYRDLKWSAKENRLWLLRMRGSTMIYPMNHRTPYADFEPRFGDAHPEYFTLYKGKRDLKRLGATGRHGLLCYSSEGVFQETIKDVDAFFSGKPCTARGIRYRYPSNRGWAASAYCGNVVSMLPHDAYKPCGCELCKPRIALGRSGGQQSEVVWGFTAKVAKEVQKRWPGKLVTQLAYSAHSKLPLTLDRLPGNVLVGICPLGLNKTYNLFDPERYDELFAQIRQWNKMSALPMAYWFHHLYRYADNKEHYAVPMLIPHFFGRFIKDLSEHGRVVYALQWDCDNYMFESLNRYVVSKLLYNLDLNVDALIDDYVEKFYGPAASVIKPMLLDIESRCERIAAAGANRGEIWGKREFFNGEVVRGYRQKADEAVKLVAGTPYAEAAGLFSKHFVGFMERGYTEYEAVSKEEATRNDAHLKLELFQENTQCAMEI